MLQQNTVFGELQTHRIHMCCFSFKESIVLLRRSHLTLRCLLNSIRSATKLTCGSSIVGYLLYIELVKFHHQEA